MFCLHSTLPYSNLTLPTWSGLFFGEGDGRRSAMMEGGKEKEKGLITELDG